MTGSASRKAATGRRHGGLPAGRIRLYLRGTGITFSLAREGRLKIEVFNVLGQRVTRLVDRTLPAGQHDARWDGRNANGSTVPSGIHYLRLESAGLSGTRKVVNVE